MPCEKRKFAGRSSARKSASGARWRIHTYYCEECRAWHLSNADKDGAHHYKAKKERRWPNNRPRR